MHTFDRAPTLSQSHGEQPEGPNPKVPTAQRSQLKTRNLNILAQKRVPKYGTEEVQYAKIRNFTVFPPRSAYTRTVRPLGHKCRKLSLKKKFFSNFWRETPSVTSQIALALVRLLKDGARNNANVLQTFGGHLLGRSHAQRVRATAKASKFLKF